MKRLRGSTLPSISVRSTRNLRRSSTFLPLNRDSFAKVTLCLHRKCGKRCGNRCEKLTGPQKHGAFSDLHNRLGDPMQFVIFNRLAVKSSAVQRLLCTSRKSAFEFPHEPSKNPAVNPWVHTGFLSSRA